jgi:hypothetical protein
MQLWERMCGRGRGGVVGVVGNGKKAAAVQPLFETTTMETELIQL